MSDDNQATQMPSVDDIEMMFINNAALLKIRAHLNKFNPIKTMKLQRKEIRHSAILAWLLSPSETHGLDDLFLKAFLCEALRGNSSIGSPTALDLAQSDLRDATVRTEWKNIDILVISERNSWVFVIENKFDSSQSKGQLEKYAATVKSTLVRSNETLKVRGIFLTLWDEEPHDPQFAPINYAAICDMLANLMDQEATRLSPDVTTFLKHYLEILRDAAGMSEEQNEMQKLAKQLYRDHKRVLDFVFEHGATTDFALATQLLFGDAIDRHSEVDVSGRKFIFDRLRNNQVSFLPSSWWSAFPEDKDMWPGCKGWWAGLPLIAWFHFQEKRDGRGGKLTLVAEVGPLTDHAVRSSLIEGIKSVLPANEKLSIGFQKGALDEQTKYSRFLKRNTTEVKDVNDPDEICSEMKALLKKFAPEFDAVSDVLPGWVKSRVEG